MSINNHDQICGLFMDSTGNILGFLRNPHDANFRTIQLPLANTFSYIEEINNAGTMAGEYSLRFEQGFLTDGNNAFSVDYPNSEASGLRAVNDRGEVGGFFIDQSGRIQAYIASPTH